jgi:hypothetical protein
LEKESEATKPAQLSQENQTKWSKLSKIKGIGAMLASCFKTIFAGKFFFKTKMERPVQTELPNQTQIDNRTSRTPSTERGAREKTQLLSKAFGELKAPDINESSKQTPIMYIAKTWKSASKEDQTAIEAEMKNLPQPIQQEIAGEIGRLLGAPQINFPSAPPEIQEQANEIKKEIKP